jgi:thioredoxin reductase (NADPH)
MTANVDCIVVGAGPAGLTAALYLARFRRAVWLSDTGASRAAWIPRSHNHPGFPGGITGDALLQDLRRHAAAYGIAPTPGAVRDAAGRDATFTLETEAGPVAARTILLATGVVDILPAEPGMASLVRQGLLRLCPICDGFEARDRSVCVIGRGASAVGEARFLRTYTDRLALLWLDGGSDADGAATELGPDIEIVRPPVTDITAEGHAVRVALADGSVRTFDLAYAALGTEPRNDLAQRLGVALDADGRVLTDAHQATSIAGVYAAGDLVAGLNQISTAMGQAVIAATAIHNHLRADDDARTTRRAT